MEGHNVYGEKRWMVSGLTWGFFMYIIMEVIFPLIDDEPFELKHSLLGIVVWALAGLVYGYVLYRFNRKNKKKGS